MTHLTFGYSFNKPINLPNSLTHLTFGYSFNQLIDLPNNLTHLTFGYKFNQPITLPDSLTYLYLEYSFSKPLRFRKDYSNNKSKLKIIFNYKYFDKIFPIEEQYNFENFILLNYKKEIINIIVKQ